VSDRNDTILGQRTTGVAVRDGNGEWRRYPGGERSMRTVLWWSTDERHWLKNDLVFIWEWVTCMDDKDL